MKIQPPSDRPRLPGLVLRGQEERDRAYLKARAELENARVAPLDPDLDARAERLESLEVRVALLAFHEASFPLAAPPPPPRPAGPSGLHLIDGKLAIDGKLLDYPDGRKKPRRTFGPGSAEARVLVARAQGKVPRNVTSSQPWTRVFGADGALEGAGIPIVGSGKDRRPGTHLPVSEDLCNAVQSGRRKPRKSA